MKEKGKKAPQHGEIHTEDGEPDRYQNTREKVYQRLDDRIALYIFNEFRELRKRSFRIFVDEAKLCRES